MATRKTKIFFWTFLAVTATSILLLAVYSINAGLLEAFKSGETAVRPKTTRQAVSNGKQTTTTERRDEGDQSDETTSTDGANTYVVQKGDTLFGIASKYGLSVSALRSINNIPPDGELIDVGQVLKLPEDAKLVETPAPLPVQPAAYASEVARGPSDRKAVALTFDAGSSAQPASTILAALRSNGIKSTFFLTGRWVADFPELTRQIRAEGHEIGNHTYDHPDLTKLTDLQIASQLTRTEILIKKITGEGSKPYFRPPYGSRDKRVLRVAAGQGYRSIYWTIDTIDWRPSTTTAQIKARVLGRLQNGAIVLMHVGSPQEAQVLPELIKEIKGRGYQMVTVSALLGRGN